MKEKILDNLVYFWFFPLYFSINGIFKYENKYVWSGSSGAVFPILVFLGVFSALVFIFNLKKYNFKKHKVLLISLIFFFVISIVHSILSVIFLKSIINAVLILQYMSGLLGIAIAIYLIKHKNFNIETIFFKISLVFLVAILMQVSLSIYKIGFVKTFGRNMYHSHFFGGIYHIFVYFPFILAMIFLYSLPVWQRKFKCYHIIYVFIGIYLLSLQVKGAILLYFVGVAGYYLIFNKKNKRVARVTFVALLLAGLIMLPKDFLIGRFNTVQFLSGREDVWIEFYEGVIEKPSTLLIGNFNNKENLSHVTDIKIFLQHGMGPSWHNQYLEVLGNYGIFNLAIFLITILLMLRSLVTKAKVSQDYKLWFWVFLVVIQLGIDLNINTPIKVTNSALFYYLYWSLLVIY